MERVVIRMDVSRINTFGRTIWKAYYYKHLPADFSPCRSCPTGNRCSRSVNPDNSSFCPTWGKWFRSVWPGKKKAASPVVETGEAASKNNHLNSTEGGPKCQP